MQHHLIKFAAIAVSTASLAFLSAPAMAQEDEQDPRIGQEVTNICFSRGIDGFRDYDRRSGLILENGRDDYLVELAGCFNLRSAQAVGVENRSICLYRGDRLIVADSPFANLNDRMRADRCTITGIYEWDEGATAEDEDTDSE